MRNQNPLLLLAVLALSLASACGGSSTPAATPPPAAATGLTYTDPPGTGWRLVRDASSTSTRLVLDLVGQAGTKTRGVGIHVQAPATVKYGVFASGRYVEDGGTYQLANASDDPAEPLAIVAGVKADHVLSAGVFQKGRDKDAKDSGAVLARIAIEFDPAAGLVTGATIPLTVLKAKVIPEDIGADTDDLRTLDRKMRMADVVVAVGALTAH